MGKVHGGSIVAIGLLVIIMMRGAEAAVDCITPLMKCAQFIGSTSPSADCCNALNETVNKDLACLCGLLGNQNLIKQFKGNVTQALELPKYCGITASTSLCGQAPQSSPPPATPGRNSGHVLSLSVVPALTSLLLFFFTVAMAQ